MEAALRRRLRRRLETRLYPRVKGKSKDQCKCSRRPFDFAQGDNLSGVKRTGNCNDEIQGSLRCGGKNAAFGRDDVHFLGWEGGTSNGAGVTVYIPTHVAVRLCVMNGAPERFGRKD
jgi:hypothetical protein